MNIKPALSLALGLLFSLQVFAQKTETRSLADFDKISISGGFDKVNLIKGIENSVKISVKGVELSRILTEVKGDNLEIGMKNGPYGEWDIKIEVTYKNIDKVNSSGSSDIVMDKLKAEKFTFSSSGSGDFTGEFEVKDLEINLSGSSDTKLKGRADNQNINISGSGDVDASKLVGNRAEVAISGSGDVKLNVERVRSSVSGSGEIDNLH